MKIGFLNIGGKSFERLNTLGTFKSMIIDGANPDVLIFSEAHDEEVKAGSLVTLGGKDYKVVKKRTRDNVNSGYQKKSDTMVFLCKEELYGDRVKDTYFDRKISVDGLTVEGIHWASPNFRVSREEDIFSSQDRCIQYHCKPDADIKIGDFNLDLDLLKFTPNEIIGFNKEKQWEYQRVNRAVGLLKNCGFKLVAPNTYTFKYREPKILDYVWTKVNGKFNVIADWLYGFDHKYIQFEI